MRADWPAIGILAVLAAAPFVGFGEGHMLTLLSRGMIFGIAAVSLALIVGGAGLVSLGHAAMLGFGAYAVVILDKAGVTQAHVVLPVAIAAGAGFALLTGVIAIRTAGVHFIMITLAFGQMAFFTAASLSAYGGDDGYTLYGRTEVFGTRFLENRLNFHFICLGALALTWLVCRLVLASRFGRVLRAARENDLRVQAVGFAPYGYRLAGYVIAGGLGGLAGFLLANSAEFVAPAYVSWQRSGELLFMVILGGLGGLHGAILGALAFIFLEEYLAHAVGEHWRMVFGPLLILSVLFLRGGLAGLPMSLRGLRRG